VYNNVLIEIFCREFKKEGIPILLVFLLWDMMWEKHLYFFDGEDVSFMRTGYKGLFQGSVLSLFMHMVWDLGLSLSANKSEMKVFPGNMKILKFRCG
jgi:hypothetical protein